MKRYFLVAMIFTLATTSINAQIRKIPSEVTEAFKAKFPGADKVEWKDKITYFEAQFTADGNEMTADFLSDGTWKETDKSITYDALPDAVKDGFKKSKYADWTPGSVTLIEKSDGTKQYKVYAEKDSVVQKKFLFFSTSGRLEREALPI